ncbi:MAG: hypothetical protein ACTSSP_04040 [Candidatus Asgardarchaeia archaeon]
MKTKTLNNYQRRWNKAKELALDILRRQKEATDEYGAKAILAWRGDPIDGQLIVDHEEIYLLMRNPAVHQSIFENNPRCDHGSHTPIVQIEEDFEDFEVYVPYSDKNPAKKKTRKLERECRDCISWEENPRKDSMFTRTCVNKKSERYGTTPLYSSVCPKFKRKR